MKKQKTISITDKKIASFSLIAALIIFQASPTFTSFAYAEDIAPDSTTTTTTEPLATDTAQSTPSESSSGTNDQVSVTSTTTEEQSGSATSDSATTSDTSIPAATSTDTSTSTSTDTSTSTAPDPTLTSESTTTFSSNGTTTLGSIIISTTTPDTSSATSSLDTASSSIDTASSTDPLSTATDTLPSGTTTIETGDSVSLANVLNLVNTNLVNSTGSIVMANMVGGHDGTIDLRTSTSTASSSCLTLGCSGIDSITANIDANANIDNAIAIVASSGNNAVATSQGGVITSGNTFAGLNLVNLANTDLIDSKYFLLSLNSFNTINGDIILPSLYTLFNSSSTAQHLDTLSVNQNAQVNNNLDVTATSGENTMESYYGETHTGTSASVLNLYNNINSLLVGGNSVMLFLKVSGKWVGELFGAPDGALLSQDGGTRVLTFENGVMQMDQGLGTAAINATTTGKINNDVKVRANSGENSVTDTENGTIDTGNSYAAANVINIANTHVIGRNWVLAIINVFGDLNGNISFGRSDLWLGEQVSANESYIKNDTELTYTITVINRGDLTASETNVTSEYDTDHLDIESADTDYHVDGSGKLVFNTGTFAPGESKVITFKAKIKNTIEDTPITNTATVTSHEPDNNPADNTDSTTIRTTSITITPIGNGGNGGNTTPPITPVTNDGTTISSLTVSVIRDTASTTIVGAGTESEQRLRVTNLTGTTIHSVTFDDVLYDTNGNKLKTETFELGDINPNEEIDLSYYVSFNQSAPAGVYSLSSVLHQTGQSDLSYPHNGSINYILGGGENLLNTFATATPLTPLKAPLAPKKVIRKGSVLGAFIESPLGIPVAHAEVAGASADNMNVSYSLIYILLFLLAALIRMYYKHIHSK